MPAPATVTVPATRAGLTQASAAFDEFCRVREVPEAARWRFQVALDEILSNTVRHGSGPAGSTVALTFERHPSSVSVEIVDDAPAFDPRQAPAPDTTLPLEARQPGGLGIVLVESLVDELAYERRDAHNHLKLTWHLRPESAAGVPSGTNDGDS